MKNKKVKQLLAVVLAAVTVLTGCGGGNTTPGKSTESKTNEESVAGVATEESKVEELEDATIQVWIMGPGKQKDSDKVWELFNEKLQEYVPNTTVEFTITPAGEYKEKFNQVLASGEAVDLAWVGYATALQTDMNDGNLMPLDDLLNTYGKGIVETLGTDTIELHRNYADGELYFLPSWQGLIGNRMAYYVPTELAELAGDTWTEDMRTAMTKLVNHYESVADLDAVMELWDQFLGAAKDAGKLYAGLNSYFFTMDGWDTNTWIPTVADVGIVKEDDSYTAVDLLQTEYRLRRYEWMADFYQKGYWRKDIMSIQSDIVPLNKANGNFDDMTAIVFCHNYWTEDDTAKVAAAAGVDITPIILQEQPTLSKGSATGMAIPYCADEPERAMMVLDAIYTQPDLYQLLVYGIEGEHYTVNGDGTITTPYGANPTADSDYGLSKWVIGTCENSLVSQGDVAGFYDRLKEAEADCLINPFINFVFDATNVEAQVAAVNALSSEYKGQLWYGALGDGWKECQEEYMAARKKAGVDDIIAEYQKQLDAFIEENGIK